MKFIDHLNLILWLTFFLFDTQSVLCLFFIYKFH